uniref:Coiled-coil and c2 domain-containing protein 2a-like n=1 Tax=Tetraselmis sp. GSL018 TaxID=582737 RepID=A0A061S480_9CHLO
MTTRMRAAERLHNPQTEDVVRDIVLPEQAAFDLSAIFAALAPIRRFGPPPKRSIPIVSHPKKVEVSVTVHHARNLPRRIGRRSRLLNDIAEEEDDFVDGGGDLDSEQINVFVQAWLQGKDKRTRSERSFGGSATWDEGFKLGLSLPHNPDYSAKALSECRDEIIISVFDEIALSGGQAAVSRRAEEGSTVTIHRIKRLLGTLRRISINALHRMSQIDGTFPLEIPAMMAGYKPAERSLPTIKLSLCFMPRLEVPLFTPKEELRSSESDVIVRHAFDWLSELNAIKQCQRRFIKAMAVDASGRAALLCRYVGMAWELPPGYDNSEQSLPRLARLVAQVPFLQDNEMRTKRHDVWTTCAKFLELGVGDNEEHATLLSGYFTALNVKNFIVLGTSINFAEDIWVLTVQGVGAGRSDPSGQQLDTSKLLLWSPLSGRSYSVDSEICPLIEVGVLFDDANIWANIQIDGHPKNVNWDLTQPGSWKPFFGPVIEPVNIRTLQQEIRRDTHYRRENNLGKLFYEGLASRADKCVWNLIRKMRTKEERESTKQALRFGQGFLRNSLNNLQDKLEEFHEVIGNPDPEAQDAQASVSARLSEEHTNALRQELRGRNVIKDFKSHLFCLPMSDDFERQVEEVLGRHKFVNLPKNWEYAVACTVVPKGLPFTCSIWVYIAALKEN